MGFKSNADKFVDIERNYKKAESLMPGYIEALKKRQENIREMRSEWAKLKISFSEIFNHFNSELKKTEAIENSYKTLVSQVTNILDDINYSSEADKFSVSIVNNFVDTSDKVIKSRNAEDILTELDRALNTLGYKKPIISSLIDLLDDFVDTARINEIISILKILENSILSFNEFKEQAKEGSFFRQNLEKLENDIEDELNFSGFMLLSNLEIKEIEGRIERPSPEELLAVLEPIRRSGNFYYKGNNSSPSNDLCDAYAFAVAKVRRALLEEREFRGTQNAFNYLTAAYEDLSEHAYSRYVKLGGTPDNYHGHDERKRKREAMKSNVDNYNK